MTAVVVVVVVGRGGRGGVIEGLADHLTAKGPEKEEVVVGNGLRFPFGMQRRRRRRGLG